VNLVSYTSLQKGDHDYDAATFEYGENTLVSPDTVVDACKRAFEADNHCVVMLHPQDFTDGPVHNAEKYESHFLALIRSLKALDVTFVQMRDLER
jgi:hypothetical protein